MSAPSIRVEAPGDAGAIRRVNDLAFGGDVEGRIVEALRANHAITVSLVALVDGAIVGHALFSPVGAAGGLVGAGLGPMAVLPEHQRRGIGSGLIAEGLARLAAGRCPYVIVLGHAEYYPRFGFVPASRYGMRCKWDVPDDVFLVRVLDPACAAQLAGPATYRPEFDVAETSGEGA